MNLLILADDFTGAMDTGVQLSKMNISTLVLPEIPKEVPFKNTCQVLVINTTLRHTAPDKAYEVMADLIQTFYEPGLHIYIKTDSALRGNVGPCLSAACNTLHLPIHFIPAFPDAGRITKDSTVYVDGELLEHSVFSRDPRSPMKKSYIPDILGDTRNLPIHKVSIPYEKTDKDFSKPSIFLYDAKTNDDLEKIGLFLQENNQMTLTAGCAGFAAQFPDLLDFNKNKPYVPDSVAPVLFLSGSANAVTFKQLAKAKEQGYPLLSMSAYLTASFEQETGVFDLEQELVSNAVKHIQNGHCPIIATATEKDDLFDLQKAKEILGSEEAIHRIIQRCCATLTKRILDETTIPNLAVFGGDTVTSILDILDCKLVEAKGQLSTGVPLCLLEYRNKTLHLVTKSGGLGEENIVKIIDNYFHANKQKR